MFSNFFLSIYSKKGELFICLLFYDFFSDIWMLKFLKIAENLKHFLILFQNWYNYISEENLW